MTRGLACRRAVPRREMNDREKAVLALVQQGLHNAAIARRLGLSEHQVSKAIENIDDIQMLERMRSA